MVISKSNWNHKPETIIDTHIRKKKQSKHNTRDSHQATKEENKRKSEKKRPTKTNPKQLTKWQKRTYISIM